MSSSNGLTTKYIVVDEHTLAYTPCGWFEDSTTTVWYGVLAGNIWKGGPDPLRDGVGVVRIGAVVRPATVEDFSAFRVQVPKDF